MIRIALDGPAGSGKSSVAKAISKKLGITYLDTGAMYRCVALYFLENRIDMQNQSMVEGALKLISIDFSDSRVFLNSNDVTDAIRTPDVTAMVPRVAELASVRRALVEKQKKIGESSSIVMDGRDIGTVVMPNAEYKFFLTASVEERASRRYKELVEKGYSIDMNELVEDIRSRDRIDTEREESPLRQAGDAVLLDTTSLSFEQVVTEIIKHVKVVSN